MPESTVQLIVHHWKLFGSIWLLSNLIGTMPSPNGHGWLASPLYHWAFNFLHTISGNVPRIMATLAPATKPVVDLVVPQDKSNSAAGGQ